MRIIMLILGVIVLAALAQAQEQLTAQVIVERATVGFKAGVRNEDVKLRVRIIEKRGERRPQTLRYLTEYGQDGAGDKTLLRFVEPSDTPGSGLLNIENPNGADTQYLYLPNVKPEPWVIDGSNRRNRFIGTHYSIGNTRSENTRLWTYRMLGEEDLVIDEEHDGRTAPITYPCWHIEAVPAEGADTDYARRVLWVHRELPIIMKKEMYDREGPQKLQKTRRRWNVSVENDAHLPRAAFEEMVDHVAGERTVLEALERRFNQDLPDSTFTKRGLKSGR